MKACEIAFDQRYDPGRAGKDCPPGPVGQLRDCEFCSGCDNRGGGRIEGIYQDYIDGKKEIREINEEYRAPFVRG